jgi:predicted O-linked N-acetylglucosamine transferase (SPINDLY family)
MGVPVISLVGETAVARSGLSILSNVGLAELAATDDDQYVAIAVALARDLDRVNQLRQSLRQRMRQSPLLDRVQFIRDLEAAYQQMWNQS